MGGVGGGEMAKLYRLSDLWFKAFRSKNTDVTLASPQLPSQERRGLDGPACLPWA